MKLRPPWGAFAVVATVAISLTGCGNTAEQAQPTKTLTLGTWQNVTSFDPAQAADGHLIPYYQAVYDTLIWREADGTYSPMLATSWEYNDDNTEMTIDLRNDVTFSDGAKFSAEAAKANIEHFKTANGPQAAQGALIGNVEVIDDDTIKIVLEAPDPSLEFSLSQGLGYMGSPDALGTDAIKTDPVGSGPYVLDAAASVNGSQFTYNKNADYWNKDLQKFDKVIFKVLEDQNAVLNALLAGQIDGGVIQADASVQAEEAGMIKLDDFVNLWAIYLFDRDGEKVPALKDVRVRQAINYALDRETIVEQMFPLDGTPTTQIFGKHAGAYDVELDDAYPYDPEKAKELLAEAGYADGFVLDLPVEPLYSSWMAMIKQVLADVGITVNLISVPGGTVLGDVLAGKYAAAPWSETQWDTWAAIRQDVSKDAPRNPFHSTTPEVQELIDAVQYAEPGSTDAAQELNQYLVDNAWFAPFMRKAIFFYVNPEKVDAVAQVEQVVPSIYNYSPASS